MAPLSKRGLMSGDAQVALSLVLSQEDSLILLRWRLGRSYAPRLAAVISVLSLVLAIGAVNANADIEGSFSGHLPGKTWTTNGAYGYFTFMWAEKTGEGPICITAAEYSGGWSFPYGWQCGHPFPKPWTFLGTGYPAVDNPNSRELAFTAGYN